MTKIEFENRVENWAIDFVRSNSSLNLVEIFKQQNLSRISHPILNEMPVSKLCDFVCDFVLLVSRSEGGYEFIFINRYLKSIGIRDIGEMQVYAKLAKPLHAFLISVNGHSSEINNILVSDTISDQLFRYDNTKHIILFALRDGVVKESVLPVFSRESFISW